MDDLTFFAVIVSLIAFFWFITWVFQTIENAKNYTILKPELDNLNKTKSEFKQKQAESEIELQRKIKNLEIAIVTAKSDLDKIAKEKSMGFPWLSEAYADYFALRDLKREEYLRTKKHPAFTAAETVREIKDEKRELLKHNKMISYKLIYLEKLFPWLTDLIAETEDEEIPVRIDSDFIPDDGDSVRNFLTPEEYKSLPSVQRNQMALDRYVTNRNKSKWAIGRDYEMYVGYKYQQSGYLIEYKGIIDGYDDLGRDIIATKDGQVCIIQCKNWAKYKDIHEKHIFQLFGTTMEYWIKNFSQTGEPQNSFESFSKFLNQNKLKPIFYTSTSLSNRAKTMADTLSIEVIENVPLGEFPRIKCNINSDEYGEKTKIYHLPMDQQYDRTIIGNQPGEFYATTVKEAEDAGFRRAFKHVF